MKIKYLKINGFGKIKNKEITFNDNINLIYGKNESGKTTLLNFIFSMFYGLTKNKNGKGFSNFDRYKPWRCEEFSGKLHYILDNNEEFEIFREFSKKNPKIYNKNLEDISNHFNIDKNKKNQFFYDQTKVDELLFLSTNIVEQQQIPLNTNNQNILTQKIANILSSGEDDVSYNTVKEKLSKEFIERVGTERTIDRPINKVLEEINQIVKLKKELDSSISINENMKFRKNELIQELNNAKNNLKVLNEIKLVKENEKMQNEKININKKIVNDYEEKINNIKNDIKTNIMKEKEVKKDKKHIINILIISVLTILNIVINFVKINNVLENIIVYFSIIYLIINLICYLYNKNNMHKKKREKNINNIKMGQELEILEEHRKCKAQEISKFEEELLNENKNKIYLIEKKFKGIVSKESLNNYFNGDIIEINYKIAELNKICVDKQLKLNTIQIREKEIEEKLENKIVYDEKLEYLYDKKEDLLSIGRSINIAKEALEKAYNDVKEEITPKFTKDLSQMMEKISNGKYKKVVFDIEKGLIVEKEDGEYMECDRLSIGTIDQLYLSLRLSAMRQISAEKMPIILDETFAYFDSERLRNILKYIDKNYKENQILILTCSYREKEIMDGLNIRYNLIKMD